MVTQVDENILRLSPIFMWVVTFTCSLLSRRFLFFFLFSLSLSLFCSSFFSFFPAVSPSTRVSSFSVSSSRFLLTHHQQQHTMKGK
jgi:uncharacterized membrane protein